MEGLACADPRERNPISVMKMFIYFQNLTLNQVEAPFVLVALFIVVGNDLQTQGAETESRLYHIANTNINLKLKYKENQVSSTPSLGFMSQIS